MAIIDMAGKWNIRVKGLTLNSTTFPVIELYFNLGYSLTNLDILNFGTMKEMGQDLQIRLNTIGNYNFICSSSTKKPTDISFNNVSITDMDKGISLTQTYQNIGGEFSGSKNTALSVRYNTDKYIGICYELVSYGAQTIQGFSPLIMLHDEFTDELLLLSNGNLGVVFHSNIPIVSTENEVACVNELPIPSDSETTMTFSFIGYTENVLETINPSDSDPYNPNGEPAGGGGEVQTPDEMQDETLPTISVADTGFVTLYKPSISQMNSLASYMWGAFDIDAFKKVFANPMDVILGLSILPGIVPAGGSSNVMVGNVNTGVSMTKVANQYVKFDCGSVTIKRRWGAFLDYSPYTKAFIYLPFIGVEPIDVDEIMNKTVSVTYNIDVLSGGCCAFIKVDGTTLYSYIGQCACSVPVTGKDWSTMINGVLGAVSGITGTIGSLASGNVAGAVSGIASVAQNVTGAKPTYQRSGSMGGMGGMMGIKTPYIIIERPVQAVPGYQNQIIGYPSFITRLIGDFRGYTEIEQCHLENIPCTGDEMIEIENILKTGVIL